MYPQAIEIIIEIFAPVLFYNFRKVPRIGIQHI